MTTAISLVIPAYNSWRTLPQLLASIASGSDRPDQVIVVDDGSDRFELPSVDGLRVEWVRLEHQGPIAARNAGWRAATCPWVIFLDSDCTVHHEWCAAYRRAVECQPEAVLMEGPLQETFRHGFFRHWAENVGPGRFPTANVAYRRDVLIAIGGLDPQFRWGRYYFREDSDLALRAQTHGSAAWVAQALAYHHGKRIGFRRKLLEAWRYAMDPPLLCRHGWPGLVVDGMRLGRARVPAPRQLTAVLVTALWAVTLLAWHQIMPWAVASAVGRAALVLSREGVLAFELPGALVEQLVEPVVLTSALVAGSIRMLGLRRRRGIFNASV